MREHDASLFIDARRLGQDFGVDVVELTPRRKRWVADARHAGGVLSDEVRDVGDVEPLSQHPPAALQVAREEIEMLEPRVVAVELFAEPRDAPGLLVALLLNIDVQDRRVEPFRKKAVGALLQVHRPALEPIVPARIGLRPDEPSAVDVRTARRGAVLDVAERPLAPVFAGDSVGLSAVLEKLAGEAPVSVALEPRLHAVRVRRLAESADVRIRDFVGDKPPEVPEEAV